MQTETLDLMLEHRSIRTFTDERIPEDTLHLLIKAAQAAATSSFQQCVSLVHVTDNTLREALVPLTHNQTYVATAPHFFVFCADYARHLQIVPDGKVGYTEQLLTAAIDVGLSAQNMLLAAQSYGYGGVYIGAIRNHPKDVCALLGLPKHVFPLFGLCLGKAAEQPELKPRIPQGKRIKIWQFLSRLMLIFKTLTLQIEHIMPLFKINNIFIRHVRCTN